MRIITDQEKTWVSESVRLGDNTNQKPMKPSRTVYINKPRFLIGDLCLFSLSFYDYEAGKRDIVLFRPGFWKPEPDLRLTTDLKDDEVTLITLSYENKRYSAGAVEYSKTLQIQKTFPLPGDPEYQTAFYSAIKDPDPYVRMYAAHELRLIRTPEAAIALKEVVRDDKDWRVRFVAEEVLGELEKSTGP